MLLDRIASSSVLFMEERRAFERKSILRYIVLLTITRIRKLALLHQVEHRTSFHNISNKRSLISKRMTNPSPRFKFSHLATVTVPGPAHPSVRSRWDSDLATLRNPFTFLTSSPSPLPEIYPSQVPQADAAGAGSSRRSPAWAAISLPVSLGLASD